MCMEPMPPCLQHGAHATVPITPRIQHAGATWKEWARKSCSLATGERGETGESRSHLRYEGVGITSHHVGSSETGERARAGGIRGWVCVGITSHHVGHNERGAWRGGVLIAARGR